MIEHMSTQDAKLEISILKTRSVHADQPNMRNVLLSRITDDPVKVATYLFP